MTRIIVVALFVAATSPALQAAERERSREAARKDLEKLQGTWILRSMESEGDRVPPEHFEGWHAVYEGDVVMLKAGPEVRRRGIITLDPSRQPKAINTWDQDGPYEDETVPGIYELEGDTLKFCFARPGQPRPNEFTTRRGSGFLFVVYERKRP